MFDIDDVDDVVSGSVLVVEGFRCFVLFWNRGVR